MPQKVRLTNIPPLIQERYNIGAEVEALADNSAMGGHFTVHDRQGRKIGIDAVTLTGQDIEIQAIK